jgi:1-deoxy-D-xylulose-5-phosphate synthase
VGIAEQHAVTFSAGLAANGMLPVCNIYSTFMQRAYDSIIHDVALQNLKVIFCLDRGGIVGEDGATHHGAFDMAYLRPVPNITIAAPMNEVELRNMLYSATLPQYGITAIRYPRGKAEGLDWKKDFEFVEPGKGTVVREGSGVAVLSLGAIGNRAMKGVEKAVSDGADPLFINMRFLKPLDESLVEYACSRCHTIITVEDGTVFGGLASAVSEYVAAKNYDVKIIPHGIPDKFIEQGSVDELISDCGYNADNVYDSIISASGAKNNLKKN